MLRNAFKYGVFEASKLVSTKTHNNFFTAETLGAGGPTIVAQFWVIEVFSLLVLTEDLSEPY